MSIDALATGATSNAAGTVSAAARQLQIGQQHFANGEIREAMVAYRGGIELASGSDLNQAAVDILAELHAKLGNCFMLGRQFAAATEQYKSALRLKPTLAACWCNLGNAQLETGNPQQAIALYLEALKLVPSHWASRTNLVEALLATRQYLVAKGLLMELIAERPQAGQLHHQLGRACFELDDLDAALSHLEAAIVIDPRDADSLYWVGAIRQKLGQTDAARAAYAQAAQIRPLIRRNAVKSPPEFRLLALYAPFAGNTPADYLLSNAVHDTDTLSLFEGSKVDAAALGQVQLIINLISDADQGGAVLPLAAGLIAQLDKPVINHPARIAHTTRDAVAKLLPGIPGCCIPAIVRLDAAAELPAATLAALPLSYPVLARPAGTHGGDDFEKIADLQELAGFLGKRPGCDHYVIDYVDYVSADGYFRKYRFIFVGEAILPYHLAIGRDWKLHHDHTDMADHPWMQQEEAVFLDKPEAVFSRANYAALRMIRERIGLDYFGIDCGLDREGNIVVFEVNASMLVHDDNPDFPYKAPAVHAIKRAFDAMLRERALG